MLPDYQDIKDAAGGRTPDWYDGAGVPRYREFHPDMLGVYDTMALLVEIECQSCARKFKVGDGWTKYSQVYTYAGLDTIAEDYSYGDPPIHQCVGDSMGSVNLRILEAWDRGWHDWIRRPDIEEYDIYPEWMDVS